MGPAPPSIPAGIGVSRCLEANFANVALSMTGPTGVEGQNVVRDFWEVIKSHRNSVVKILARFEPTQGAPAAQGAETTTGNVALPTSQPPRPSPPPTLTGPPRHPMASRHATPLPAPARSGARPRTAPQLLEEEFVNEPRWCVCGVSFPFSAGASRNVNKTAYGQCRSCYLSNRCRRKTGTRQEAGGPMPGTPRQYPKACRASKARCHLSRLSSCSCRRHSAGHAAPPAAAAPRGFVTPPPPQGLSVLPTGRRGGCNQRPRRYCG